MGGIVKKITVDPFNDDIIFCVLNEGLFVTENAGRDWNEIEVPTMDIHSLLILPIQPILIFIGSSTGIYISTDRGQTWDIVFTRSTYSLEFNPINLKTIYAGSNSGRIFKSMDYGKNWIEFRTGSTFNVYTLEVSPIDTNTIFAGMMGNLDFCGDGIYKTTDGGLNWDNSSLPYSDISSIVIDPISPQHIFAGSDVGIYKSFDNGYSWQLSNDGLPAYYNWVSSLLFSKDYPHHLLAALSEHGIFETETSEMQWNIIPSGVEMSSTNSICNLPDDSNSFLVGCSYGLLKGTFQGKKFSLIGVKPITISSLCIDPIDAKFIYAIGRGVFKSEDSVNTWDLYNKGMKSGKIICIDPNNPFHLYAGVYSPYGAVYESSNGSQGWECTSLKDVAINDIKIALSNSKIIFAGGLEDPFVGGLFRSTDAGANWDTLTNKIDNAVVHSIVIDPIDPLIVFVGTHSNGIYKTTNGGDNWFQVNRGLPSPSQFYGYINCITIVPVSPEIIYTGIYEAGIYKTVDGGENWEPVNNGLGNLDVRSIVIDDKNSDILYAGTWGCGVFKSVNAGNLWKSLNQGWDSAKINCLLLSYGKDQILYAATGNGIWKYFLSPTSIKNDFILNKPRNFYLYQNYPNPFNSNTTFEFSMPISGWVELSVFNNLGEEIAVIFSDYVERGFHRINWNAKNIASGFYLYRLKTDDYISIRKLLILK